MRYDEEIYIVIVYKRKNKAHFLAYNNCKEEHDLEKIIKDLQISWTFVAFLSSSK
jgi:hypothetical protein